MQSHKPCTGCGETKPLSSFHFRSVDTQKRESRCKECKSSYRQQYYDRNAEIEKVRTSKWQKENKDQHNANNRRWRAENLDKAREGGRKTSTRYNLEHREYIASSKSKRDHARQKLTEDLAINHGMNWDPVEDELLLAEDGLTVYQKAIKLGRTYASTKMQLYRLRKQRAVAP